MGIYSDYFARMNRRSFFGFLAAAPVVPLMVRGDGGTVFVDGDLVPAYDPYATTWLRKIIPIEDRIMPFRGWTPMPSVVGDKRPELFIPRA